MRLIDADALIDKMYYEAFKNDASYDERNPMAKWDSGLWIRYKMFENAIDDTPTIEPKRGKADRPQGEWIRTGRTNIYGGIEVQCSNCGDRVMVQHLEDEWYCRHCGADMGMKGADDEKTN